MKESERIKLTKNLKSIINNSLEHLPTGELLDLINLSARTDLYFRKNNMNKDGSSIENELMRIIKKYNQFIK